MASRNLTVTLGLLSFPAKAEKATVTKVSNTNMCVGQPGHDAHEAQPVKMPRTCESCGPIVDNTLLVKGVKEGTTYRIVSQEDVAEKKAEYANAYKGALNLVPHPATEFLESTGQGDKINYLTPANAQAESQYQLIVKLIEDHPELVFASLYTPTSVTGLYMLRVRNGVLVMEERTRTQDLKPAPTVGGEVNDALYGMLSATIDQFVTPYDPDAYEDKYATALAKLAAESTESVTMQPEKAEAVATSVASDADLMAKLQALKTAQ